MSEEAPHRRPGFFLYRMAELLRLTKHSCERGDLTVFERVLPGSFKRVFYIMNADGTTRGGHRHIKAWQAVVCIQGSVDIVVESEKQTIRYSLSEPDHCLVLEPDDWHLLENFRGNAIVLVVSNEHYDEQDYIYERYAHGNGKRVIERKPVQLLV